MKKIYFLIVAMLVGFAASASLYVAGDFKVDGVEQWNPDGSNEFDFKGFYTITLKDCANFKISTACGTWDEFNTGALQCASKLVDGESQALFAGTDNIVLEGKADWTITVTADLSTITATAAGEVAQAKVYLRGDFNSWGAGDEWEMTLADGVLTSKVVTIEAGQAFKVADEFWGEINYGGAADMVATESYVLEYNSQTNCSMAENFTGIVMFDLATTTISFDGESSEPTVPTETTVALAGSFNGWSTEANATTELVDNCATFEVADWTNGESGFKFVINGKWLGGVEVKNGKWTEPMFDGDDMLLPADAEGKTVSFTVAVDTKTFVASWESDVEPTPTPEGISVYYDNAETKWATPYIHYWDGPSTSWPGVPMVQVDGDLWGYILPAGTKKCLFHEVDGDQTADLDVVANAIYNFQGLTDETCDLPIEGQQEVHVVFYLRGEFNKWGYDETADRFAYEDGHYSIEKEALSGQFVIATDDWGVKFGADAHGEEVDYVEVPANATSLFWLGSCNAATDGDWTNVKISFDYKQGDKSIEVVISATDAVESIAAAANEAAEYFNLQGVRVANPENGLYIVRKGGNVSKVMIR